MVAANYMSFLKNTPYFYCLFQPVVLDSFAALPRPNPYIEATPISTATPIQAHLVRIYADGNALKADLQGVIQDGITKLSQVALCTTPELSSEASMLSQSINTWADDFASRIHSAQTSDQPVYKCDLAGVTPKYPNEIQPGSPADDDSRYLYYFTGLRDTRSALNVRTIAGHFVRRIIDAEFSTAAAVIQTPVDVRGPHPALFLTGRSIKLGSLSVVNNQQTVEVKPTLGDLTTGYLGHVDWTARQLNDTTWEVVEHADSPNNEPEGTTSVSISGKLGFVTPPLGPVPVEITMSTAEKALPFTDRTGAQTLGQATTMLGAVLRCKSTNSTLGNSQSVGPGASGLPSSYMFGPSTVACSDTSAFNFTNTITGFIGAFTADVNLRIQLQGAGTTSVP
jgi:hypothetical protein